MHPWAVALAVLLIVVILWDAFETIILSRRVSRKFRLTRAFYRLFWTPWRAAARRVPEGNRRENVLMVFGPLSLILLLVTWAVGLVTGFGLLHWGSVNEGSRIPRVSVAFEWIAEGEEPGEDEKPLLSLDDDPPPFEERMRLIARAVRTYHGFDPALSSSRALADELLA